MDAGINPDCNHLVCDVDAVKAGLNVKALRRVAEGEILKLEE